MKLKICGLKDPENIKQVAKLNPDYMGFIFYPESKRYVGEDFIMPLISSEIKKVGVFVNASAIYIVDMIDNHQLDAIQLHGNESSEFCEVINHITPVIKAFGVDKNFDFNVLKLYENSCDYFLFDTKTPQHGGSGKSFDWNLLNKYSGAKPFFLSGGIGEEEIKKVQSLKFKVLGLDVNSRFETEPGVKDVEKLKLVVG